MAKITIELDEDEGDAILQALYGRTVLPLCRTMGPFNRINDAFIAAFAAEKEAAPGAMPADQVAGRSTPTSSAASLLPPARPPKAESR